MSKNAWLESVKGEAVVLKYEGHSAADILSMSDFYLSLAGWLFFTSIAAFSLFLIFRNPAKAHSSATNDSILKVKVFAVVFYLFSNFLASLTLLTGLSGVYIYMLNPSLWKLLDKLYVFSCFGLFAGFN